MAIENQIICDKWHGCYDDGWQGIIVPEAFAHPAKMAHGLTRKIFKHALSESWIKPGDVVVDPFGGIGSTGIIGAALGLRVVCVELEEKFVALGKQNFELNRKAFACSHFGHSYQPQIIQGDSRELYGLLRIVNILSENAAKYTGADCVVGSPPFVESLDKGTVNPAERRKLAREKGISNAEHISPIDMERIGKRSQGDYGQTPGQLGAMKPGSVDAVVSSPPYAESLEHKGGIDPNKSSHSFGTNSQMNRSDTRYGQTPGNLGNLKPGDPVPRGIQGKVDAVVSSPPYEGIRQDGSLGNGDIKGFTSYTGEPPGTWHTQRKQNNMGNQRGETFWQAARQIVQQCHQILKPGGHAIWVVKAFVRKGKIVDFPGDWRRLCEAEGFETVHEHHAMLVKETKHDGLFEEIVETKARKSFFRGLHETKAAWKMYWETIPSKKEKAIWKFKASLLSRFWSDPIELYNPLAMCFEASGEDERDWNEHVRIDYETVLCMRAV